MATVMIEVNGRQYSIGCEDGQEAHVAHLARQYDRQVREVSQAVGQVGELRLFLMAALAEAQAEIAKLRDSHTAVEAAAARAVSAAALRIEELVKSLGEEA